MRCAFSKGVCAPAGCCGAAGKRRPVNVSRQIAPAIESRRRRPAWKIEAGIRGTDTQSISSSQNPINGVNPDRNGGLCQFEKWDERLQKFQELLDCHICRTNQRSQKANRKFLMLRNGKIHPHAGPGHYAVATNLSHEGPASTLKRFNRFFPDMLASFSMHRV